jgi:hypothetical protein
MIKNGYTFNGFTENQIKVINQLNKEVSELHLYDYSNYKVAEEVLGHLAQYANLFNSWRK